MTLLADITIDMLDLKLHGFLSSCIGPIIDVQIRSTTFRKEKYITNCFYFTESRYSYLQQLYLPTIYDALLLNRFTSQFRNSIVINNPNQSRYYVTLSYHDNYIFGIFHLCCTNYWINHYSRVFLDLLQSS